MPRLNQASFARGEIGEDLYGRVDVSAYSVALRKAINCVIHAYGGVSNRSGLKFIGPCADQSSGVPPKLIEFKYNTEDTYILEFSDFKMRVIRGDAYVLEDAKSIQDVTQANPGVVQGNSHGLANNDNVFIHSGGGMSQLDQRWFRVIISGTDFFHLYSKYHAAYVTVDTTGYDAHSSGGSFSKVYEITTPYAIEDVALLKVVQSANVMTLTHPDYPTQSLTRTDHDAWTITEVTFEPEQTHPTFTVTVNAGTGTDTYYQVTALNTETGEESLPGTVGAGIAILSITKATSGTITTTASHGLVTGDPILIEDIVGMTELNDRRFIVSYVSATQFIILNSSRVAVDTTDYTAYSGNGNVYKAFGKVSGAAAPNNLLTVSSITAKSRVYRRENGLFALIGETQESTFTDSNIAADLSLSPPESRNPFFGAGNYPGVATYFQQRRVFGGSTNNPDSMNYSVTGSENNMTYSSPRQADDAITATLTSQQVNEIRALVPLSDLLVFTSGSEWEIDSGSDVAFSAETLRQRPQSNWGSSHLKPIVVGDKVLFVTENSTYIRSFGYEITVDGYKGNDMTVFAPHIFERYPVVDWAFTRWPDPLINIVREDGWVACLTFNPEQEVVAWSRWKTDGKFKAVASTRPSITEADLSSYFVVERKLGGENVFLVERVASRRFFDIRDCFFVDSGLSTDDNPIAITGATAAYPVVLTCTAHGLSDGDIVDVSDIVWEPTVSSTFTETQPAQLNDTRYLVAESDTNTFELVQYTGNATITGVTQANPAVVTAVAHGFSDGDVVGIFNVVGMTELNGNTYKVANKTDDTFELTDLADVDIDSSGYTAYSSAGDAYPAADGSAFNAYDEGGFVRETFTTLGGLWHLEGEEIVVLADGNVESGLTVADGSVTLTNRSSRAHAGLRYTADVETLDPELTVGGGSLQGKKVNIPFVTVRVKRSRGLLAGPNQFELSAVLDSEFQDVEDDERLLTGMVKSEITPDWSGGGRVYLRQPNPLPLTVTAILPYLVVGDDDEE